MCYICFIGDTVKKAHNRIDMVGKRYNDWLVLEHSHTNGKIPYYLCKCMAGCDKQFVVDGRNIRNGTSKRCVNCGFKNASKIRTGVRKSKLSAYDMRLNYLFGEKRKLALARGLAWELSIKQFEVLIFANCHYSGLPPSTTVNILKNKGLHSTWGDEGNITYNGIDRIDSSKGYIPGNVVTANSKINCAKNDDSVKDFLAWVKQIAIHQNWIKE
jgi:hypothetical protein